MNGVTALQRERNPAMITFFSTPKPFRGHIGIIQRNAIQSWKRVHPQAEVILFGDDEGAADAARALQIRHIPDVKRNEHGTKYLSPLFDDAQDIARFGCLCYVNCDIILLSDFRAAVERVLPFNGSFLMAGQRWDTDINAPLDFSAPDWEKIVGHKSLEANHQRPSPLSDYFVFSRGLFYKNTPPFVIGRPGWDNWLVWYARHSGARVVDATEVVHAIHQNHDYSYHPEGEAGVWQGEEAQQNYALLGEGHFATIDNATHRLIPNGLRPNYYHWVSQTKRKVKGVGYAVWFGLLDLTRPLRRLLGLRQRNSPEAPR
jgi:hypothetical protein